MRIKLAWLFGLVAAAAAAATVGLTIAVLVDDGDSPYVAIAIALLIASGMLAFAGLAVPALVLAQPKTAWLRSIRLVALVYIGLQCTQCGSCLALAPLAIGTEALVYAVPALVLLPLGFAALWTAWKEQHRAGV
jgi:hypothetical protein